MSANVRLLTYDEMKALLDEHKQEHIYQVLPHFNIQHPIFQQVKIYHYLSVIICWNIAILPASLGGSVLLRQC